MSPVQSSSRSLSASSGSFSTAFYGLVPADIPNLSLLVNATSHASEQFAPASEVAPTCVNEVEKFAAAIEHIGTDLGVEIGCCEISLIADPRTLQPSEGLFFSTYLWSQFNGPEFLSAYNRAMNSMSRIQLGSASIVGHPDFLSGDIAYVHVAGQNDGAEESLGRLLESSAVRPKRLYVRRYVLRKATRPSSVVDRCQEFHDELISSTQELGNDYGKALAVKFQSWHLLVVPLFRQPTEQDRRLNEQQRGQQAGAVFIFYKPGSAHELAVSIEAELARRLAWIFAEGFNREAQAVFGRVAEHRDVLYNMIHTTVNALNSMNTQALDAFLVSPTKSDRSAPRLRYRLVSKRNGRELDADEERDLAAQVRTAHQLQSMTAALLKIAEMSFNPGILRQKFQAREDRPVLEVLADCVRAVNDKLGVDTTTTAAIRLEPSPSSDEARQLYGKWCFPAGYVHQSVIWQIIFELLGNAGRFGEQDHGVVVVAVGMEIGEDGPDTHFRLRLRNQQRRAADPVAAPTGLASLSAHFLSRANGFLEAANLGQLYLSARDDSEFEATLQLHAIPAERPDTADGACMTPPVAIRG